MAAGRKHGSLSKNKSIADEEYRLCRRRKHWTLRIEKGLTIAQIERETGYSPTTICDDLERVREEIRQHTQGLAERERNVTLNQIDHAISRIMPYVVAERVQIESDKERANGDVVRETVEEHDARIKGINALVKLWERKAKLLGLDLQASALNVTVGAAKEPPEALAAKLGGVAMPLLGMVLRGEITSQSAMLEEGKAPVVDVDVDTSSSSPSSKPAQPAQQPTEKQR